MRSMLARGLGGVLLAVQFCPLAADAGEWTQTLVPLACDIRESNADRNPAILVQRSGSAPKVPTLLSCVRPSPVPLGFALETVPSRSESLPSISPSLAEQKGIFEQEVSLPLVGTISLRPGRPFRSDPVHHDNLTARHGQSGELWNRFLDGVRSKARIYRNTIQFVKNFD